MFVFITIFFFLLLLLLVVGCAYYFLLLVKLTFFFCPAECREVWFHSTVLLRCSRWLSAGVRNGRWHAWEDRFSSGWSRVGRSAKGRKLIYWKSSLDFYKYHDNLKCDYVMKLKVKLIEHMCSLARHSKPAPEVLSFSASQIYYFLLVSVENEKNVFRTPYVAGVRLLEIHDLSPIFNSNDRRTKSFYYF